MRKFSKNNPYYEVYRDRKNLSPRMRDMLEYIRKHGKVHRRTFTTYNDKRTINALINRCMIHNGLCIHGEDEYWIVSDDYSDEKLLKHAELWEERH